MDSTRGAEIVLRIVRFTIWAWLDPATDSTIVPSCSILAASTSSMPLPETLDAISYQCLTPYVKAEALFSIDLDCLIGIKWLELSGLGPLETAFRRGVIQSQFFQPEIACKISYRFCKMSTFRVACWLFWAFLASLHCQFFNHLI